MPLEPTSSSAFPACVCSLPVSGAANLPESAPAETEAETDEERYAGGSCSTFTRKGVDLNGAGGGGGGLLGMTD